MRRLFLRCALLCVGLCGIAEARAQNLVTNGSFEKGLAGWNVSGSVVVIDYGGSDGPNFVSLSRDQTPNNGRLSQTVATTAGGCYTLAFDFGAVDYTGNNPQSLRVIVRNDAVTLLDWTIGPVSYGGVYQFEAYAIGVVPVGSETTIEFLDVSGNTFDADGILDNVRLSPGCPPDFDCDGFVNGTDFDAYVQAFEAGDSRADFDHDGFITGLDFDLYVQAFEAGC